MEIVKLKQGRHTEDVSKSEVHPMHAKEKRSPAINTLQFQSLRRVSHYR